MNKKNFTAFSLIEIAVVMIIIGILVAGISQSKKLIAQTRINTARANTLSSPILSTQGLIFWFETVLEKSFLESQQEDLAPISKWIDLNASQTIKFDLSQSASTNRPIYLIKGINDLPSLEFIGNSFMEIPYHQMLNPVSFSIFIVAKIKSLPSSQVSTILCNNNSNRGLIINSFLNQTIPNYQIGLGDNSNLTTQNLASTNNAFNKTDLITIMHSGTALTSFYNSNNSTNASNNFAINLEKKLVVGVNNCNLSLSNFLQGQIGEIIMFDRNLKSEERVAIEKYLIRKWGISAN